MGNSLICSAIDDVKKSSNSSSSITIAHCSDGLILEMDPLPVAELMIEFPGHFLAHLDSKLLQDLAMDRAEENEDSDERYGEDGLRPKARRLSAMAAQEITRPGQIYALLPMALLHKRLRAHHWSALARLLRARRGGAASRSSVRATSKIAPINMSASGEGWRSDEDDGEGTGVVCAMKCGGGRHGVWTPKLETIAE